MQIGIKNSRQVNSCLVNYCEVKMSVFSVFLDCDGTRSTIHLKSSFTIEQVKDLIAYKYENIHVKPFICKGRVLSDSKTISHYDIKTDETIYVISRGKPFNKLVLVKLLQDETILSVNVNEFITIGLLKHFIYEQIWKKGSGREISLLFGGRELEDEKRLSEYNIRSDDILNFDYKLDSLKTIVHIFIKTPAGDNIHRIFVDLSHTGTYLKAMLHFTEGIPYNQQRLIYRGLQLDDEIPLSDYGLIQEDDLTLVFYLRGGGHFIRDFLFTDVTEPFRIRRPFVTECSFRDFCNGVSSEGVCVNPKCHVFAKKFVCQHGYGLYRVNEDPTRCPECQGASPRVESFGFSRANVVIRTMPLGLKTQQVEIRSNLSEAKGNYAHLPDFILSPPNTNRDYEFIEVFSSTPDCSITLSEQVCPVCSRTLYGSSDCSHGLPDIVSLTL